MIGALVPLESIHATSCSLPNIPLFEGENVIGRDDLKITDKRVSRKHISLKASANESIEVFVVSLVGFFFYHLIDFVKKKKHKYNSCNMVRV